MKRSWKSAPKNIDLSTCDGSYSVLSLESYEPFAYYIWCHRRLPHVFFYRVDMPFFEGVSVFKIVNDKLFFKHEFDRVCWSDSVGENETLHISHLMRIRANYELEQSLLED